MIEETKNQSIQIKEEVLYSDYPQLENEESFILTMLSVYGKSIEFENLRRLTNYTSTALYEILNKLLDKKVLCRDLEGGKYNYYFSQSSLRDKIYKDLNQEDRERLHLNIGKCLEAFNQNVLLGDVAYHLIQGSDERINHVVKYSHCIGEELFRNNQYQNAIELYELLLMKMGDKLGEESPSIKQKLAEAYSLIGEYNKALDIYKNEITNAKNSIEIATNYKKMANTELKRGAYLKALELLELSKDILGENKEQIVSVNRIMANIFVKIGEYQRAIELCESTLKNMDGSKQSSEYAMLYSVLGNAYIPIMKYEKARQYFQKGLKIYEELGDKRGIAITLHNLGLIEQMESDVNSAIKYYRRSIKLVEKTGNKHRLANFLLNIGTLQHQQADYKSAIQSYHQSLEIYSKIESKLGWARVGINLSALFATIGHLDKAESYIYTAVDLAKKENDILLEGYGYIVLGKVEEKRDDYSMAERLYLDAIEVLSRSLSFRKELCLAQLFLGNLYYMSGDISRAMELLPGISNLVNESRNEIISTELQARFYLLKSRLFNDKVNGMKRDNILYKIEECIGQINDQELKWELHYACGELLTKLGMTDEAETHYLESSKILRKVISNLPREYRDGYKSDKQRRCVLNQEKKINSQWSNQEVNHPQAFKEIIGSSPQIKKVLHQLEHIIDSSITVLITGETGTGKELIARAIHYGSNRREKPFVIQNCSSIPDTLLESELFGHKKGAFTGAIADKVGLFELADGGTIFLDEIGNTSATFQAKLLRVLQNKDIRPVGSTKSKKIDVRVITATNMDLAKAMKEGDFRKDIYYRLNAYTIHLPALRERGSDIILLTRYFIERYCSESGKGIKKLSKAVKDILVNYNWPGNVRELENAIKRAVVVCQSEEILPKDIPREILGSLRINTKSKIEGKEPANKPLDLPIPFKEKSGDEVIPYDKYIDIARKYLISIVMEKTRGNKTEAARLLKIDRKHLYNLIKSLGI